ncbi:hypothetical protein [Rhodococcus sp. NPDC058521]|uniref:hypothetical protein n=1 Tax=Rhodococcus sp. NPDC058521 TaxID=3346536 RepID=UPI00365BA048
MTTGVGLYVGETQSVAVVTTPGAALRTVERATVLTPTADGGVELGTRGKDSVEGFVEMVGATEGIKYAGADTRAEDLIATAMFCLFRDIATNLHGDVDVVAAHPSGWSEEATQSLRESLDYMGLLYAKLISAEDAVAASTESYATDDEAGSAVSDSRPGWAAAHGGALMASGMKLSRNAQPFDTDSFPVVPREQPIAYSQAIVVPASEHFVAADIGPTLPPAAVAKVEPAASRKPLLLAGAAAGVLTVIGIAAALTIGYTGSTDAPPIRDATQAEATSPTTTRNAPMTFPTVKPQEATYETPVRTVADPLPVVVEAPVTEAPPVEIPTAEPPASDPAEPPSPTTEEPTETSPTETTTPPETTTPTDTTDPEDPDDSESPEPTEDTAENTAD